MILRAKEVFALLLLSHSVSVRPYFQPSRSVESPCTGLHPAVDPSAAVHHVQPGHSRPSAASSSVAHPMLPSTHDHGIRSELLGHHPLIIAYFWFS